MNVATKQTARSRRRSVPGFAPRCPAVRSIHFVDRSADAVTARYCHATYGGQCEQRPLAGFLALFVGGSRLDKQGPYKAQPACSTGARPRVLHQAGPTSKQDKLVRSHMGAVAPSSRHGLRCSSTAARCLSTVDEKRAALYGYRTYAHPYRYGYRTRRVVSKYGYRTYALSFWPFLSTESVHLLDMPSVGLKKGLRTHQGEEAAAYGAALAEVQP